MDNKLLNQKEEQLKQKLAELRNLEKQVQGLRMHHGLVISDHAIVRYLERTGIVNFEWVKKQLVNDQVLSYYKSLGDGTYPTGVAGLRIVIKNSTIITVLT